MTELFDTSGLKRAFKALSEKFREREPVYRAIYVSDAGGGYHNVDLLNPDDSRGPRRRVRGRVIAYPGVHVRLSIDHQRYGPDELVIMGPDEGAYGTEPAPSMLERHGETHGWNQIDETYNLATWQLYPLRVQPYSGMTVRVLPGLYFAAGLYRQLSASSDVDLTAYKPAAGWKWVTLSIDELQNITVTEGPEGSSSVSSIPVPPSGEGALAAVLLHSADTTLSRDRMRADLRYIGRGVSSGGGYTATQVGQVLFSVDGVNFDNETPVTSPMGWLVNEDGTLIVVG